ncbi:serine/threonine protein kinase [Chitiniphilus eburneus]|uniref:Stress response kinase A n=1 Tax=Chitiniphilus eburneus TaxID=2571148 RepID=A0A4U0QBT7_9NEIS|nr:serine/threonine protein kinase [Chitiniphilus eburneus]TJZ78853.1 serine/threonine protein kinase [Chitiniphilus eburneus]
MTDIVSADTPHAYAALTPDCVLDAVESVGIAVNGSQFPLNSYENRVYQVGIEDAQPLIAKFYRPGRWSDAQILEEHTFANELAEREIPMVAPLAIDGVTLFGHAGFRFALFPRRGGRAPELDNRDTLEWLGRFIGRIHAVGAISPFAHRPALTPETFGHAPRAYLLEHGFIPADLLPAYESVSAQALEGVAHCYARAGNVATLRLHGDVHPGNVLWTPDGPHFVDLDDARTGPAIQDLWMLLSGEREERVVQLADVLAGYEDFHEFDARELHLVEALRTLRLIHYAGWLAQRWDDPAFPHAFPWFNSQRYWQEHILALREQVAAMDEPPLWPTP